MGKNIFFFTILLWTAVVAREAAPAAPKTSLPSKNLNLNTELVKEVQDLLKNLKKTEKRMLVIAQQLGLAQQESQAVNAKAAAVVTSQLEHLTKEFHMRVLDFSSDLQTTVNAIWEHPSMISSISHGILVLIISFFIAILSVGVGGLLLQQHLEKSIFRLKSKTFLQLSRLNTLFILPMPVYFCISVLVGMGMQAWGVGSNTGWHLNACSLFPLNLYCVWALYTWIGLIWMPNRPSQGFIIMRPEDALKSTFWLRFIVGIYAFSTVILGVIVILMKDGLEKNAIIRTILDVGVMVSCWCAYKGLSIQSKDVALNVNPKKIVRILMGVRWSCFGVTILWLMSRKWFLHFLFPVTMTAIVWIFYSLLKSSCVIIA